MQKTYSLRCMECSRDEPGFGRTFRPAVRVPDSSKAACSHGNPDVGGFGCPGGPAIEIKTLPRMVISTITVRFVFRLFVPGVFMM